MKKREPEQTWAEAEEFRKKDREKDIKKDRKKGASQDMLSAEEAPRFDREQLLASERYRSRRDLAEALLEKGRQYTIEEAEGLISGYMKGKVV